MGGGGGYGNMYGPGVTASSRRDTSFGWPLHFRPFADPIDMMWGSTDLAKGHMVNH